MAWRKDPLGNPVHAMLVLAEHGMSQPQWLECEGDWTPRVGGDTILGQPNPTFDPERAQRFRVLMQQESDRINGIMR
jgi:hypothetical protein